MKTKKMRRGLILSGLFLSFFFSPLSATAAKLKVTAELANVRLKPFIGSIIIRQIPQGAILESLRKEGEWYLVKLEPDEGGNASGYVHESLVMAVEPLSQTERVERPREIPPREERQKPAPPEESQPSTLPKMLPENTHSITLFGGGNYAAGGDLNKGAEGMANYYSEDLRIKGVGAVSPLHLTCLFGAEFSFPLASRLLLGIGAEFIQGQKESSVKYPTEILTYNFTARPEIQALPIKVNLSYYPLRYLYFKLGVAYYLAKCTYFYRFEYNSNWLEWQGTARARNFGFQGAIGFEWPFASRYALLIELSSQYALIKGFRGEGTFQDPISTITEEGELYIYQGKTSAGSQKSYPFLLIRSRIPWEGYVENPRAAEISLSGMALKAGIKIMF
ncbi:MAG: hypothetical protein WCC06_06075 [Candidatus Aminicenantales bacterium]